MTERKEIKTRESSHAQEQQTEREFVVSPVVDIFEDAEGITLRADLPGVSKERLSIQVDAETLVVEGDAHIDMPEGMEALYADIRSTRYRRSFALSGELETSNIDASLKDGVLSLHIPKRAEVRPRKIEVRTN